MPSSFVTSPDVSLRREKCIPAKIMKPLFHFFSLHFISPPPPSHLISRSGPGCTTASSCTGWRESTSRFFEYNDTWSGVACEIQFSKMLRRNGIVRGYLKRLLISEDFYQGIESWWIRWTSLRIYYILISLRYSGDWWFFKERERRKEVLEQTMTLLMSLWGEIWKKISFSQSWKSGTSAHGIIYFTSAISRFPFVYIANI